MLVSRELPMNIQHDVSLKPYNTFGIDVFAHAFVGVTTHEELDDTLFHVCGFERSFVLGGGSNVLFTRNFDGLVVHLALRGIRVYSEDDEFVTIESSAGERWDDLVQYCVERNWGGIENLSLIPGTVGAAPVQNIGAYGVELQDTIVCVQGVMRQTGDQRIFTREQCRFGYRDSVFKRELRDQCIVTSIRLRLRKNPRAEHLSVRYGAIAAELGQKLLSECTIRDVSEAVRRIRRSKLPNPAELGNAGSFFKNPEVTHEVAERIKREFPAMPLFPALKDAPLVKLPAGWLIEQCGWKGKRIGNTGAHIQQALVLVNYGGASGNEVFACAQAIQESVQVRFGVRLEMEVNIV